ncbi:MAG TPA: GGDEF domain-containing protein [Candidatus Baltobacteraceae bacterium]
MRNPEQLLEFARRLANAGFDIDSLTYWLTAFVQSLIPGAQVRVGVFAPDGTLDAPPVENERTYPLRSGGRETGVLSIDAASEQIDAVSGDIEVALEFFAPALAAATSLRDIESRVVRDALTGLYNRSYALLRLEEELARARRRNASVCALLVDLAGLKDINARYGFPSGDAAIRTAAHALRSVCRITDIICRYEADRFLVIYVDVDPKAIGPMSRRAREQIESRVLAVPGGAIGMKTFGGIACSSEDTTDASALIAHAEADLQRDKRERK